MKIISKLMLSMALVAGFCLPPLALAEDAHWVASWGESPFAFFAFGGRPGPQPLHDQTLRQVVRLSAGGDAVRVKFTNELGTTPLIIGHASIAIATGNGSIDAATLRPLTFGGRDSISIPAGAPALSDALDMPVKDLTELAIMLYLPDETPLSSIHMGRIAYVSAAGDYTGAADLKEATASTTQSFLSGVYVSTTQTVPVVVAFGDSITDGTASTPMTFNSWPDHFAARLSASGKKRAVVNQGIAGNQVLQNGAGISALGRFNRDVLTVPGLTHIILLEGINDIGVSGGGGFGQAADSKPTPVIEAQQIIDGYRQLIARAHTHSPAIRIYGATLTPFEGVNGAYYSPEKDKVRQEVNAWIRSSGEFDAVIDFEKAVQDPANPNRMKAEYDSGDHLHPGDAGYRHMAESIDLSLF
ncbi:MAG: SGNH/GDSL hydrolase family protein [Pseudomonadales bacterium]|nr:SGNH/GDSL hydrolase family protein [Pseudomonadales bacterium]